MIDIQTIIIQIGQSGIIVAGVVFVLRKAIDLFFSKDLEKYKFELEKSSAGFKIRYEKLHTERANVIKDLYQKISQTYQSFIELTSPLQYDVSEEAKARRFILAAKNASEMNNFYESNRIFFEESIAREIDGLMKLFRSCFLQFKFSQEEDIYSNECLSAWKEAWKQVDESGEITRVKQIIENKFRSIIGISETNLKNMEKPETSIVVHEQTESEPMKFIRDTSAILTCFAVFVAGSYYFKDTVPLLSTTLLGMAVLTGAILIKDYFIERERLPFFSLFSWFEVGFILSIFILFLYWIHKTADSANVAQLWKVNYVLILSGLAIFLSLKLTEFVFKKKPRFKNIIIGFIIFLLFDLIWLMVEKFSVF